MRVRTAEAAKLTGLSIRMIQKHANSGQVPGAAKLCGVWTFDRDTLKAWVNAKEREVVTKCQISLNEEIRGTHDFRLTDINTSKAYAQLISG